MRIFIIISSLIIFFILAFVGSAEIVFENAQSQKNVKLFKMAEGLNPFVSEYFYEDYELTKDINALRQAMRLEPTKPAYHMYYGLALIDQKPRTRVGDQQAVIEICKAARLKPYSKQYQEICNKFKAVISIPT